MPLAEAYLIFFAVIHSLIVISTAASPTPKGHEVGVWRISKAITLVMLILLWTSILVLIRQP